MVTIHYTDITSDKDDNTVIDTFYRTYTLNAHILFESMMLPQTGNQLNARGVGLWNGTLNVEECISTKTEGKSNKFLDISENDTTLNITWQIIDNCCFSFLGDFEMVNDSTLNCIYHSYGKTHCACDCENKITYQLNKVKGYEEDYKKLKYISLNGTLLSKFPKNKKSLSN
ncbi:hypothetical protein ACE193_19585 [Bernardetia sp. OM2101]|uniref:hypothetical protein n=1 Tax=Bernardetia sp. OM2101 TaxID=3344876 RepID=UPI0035CE96DA